MTAKPVPDGYHSVTPYLIAKDAAKAIEFYRKVFGAQEVLRMDGPGGKVAHAEIKIGDSHVMLADEVPSMGFVSPQTLGGVGVSLLLYVDDVDAIFSRAMAAGSRQLKPLEDQFYGDRAGTLEDPFGHCWTVATHKEDVPPQEMERRLEQLMEKKTCA
jgi:PhnB protein